MRIGIDKIGIYIPKRYLDIRDLAVSRNIDPDKFTKGLGQDKMAIVDKSQDIVSMGVMASKNILTQEDKENIDLLIVATETGLDYSKAASTYIHGILKLNPYCRSYEIKEACFGGTAALMIAKDYISKNSGSKVLIITSDIAKYGIGSGGESTQGAGAISMLITENPSIASVEDGSVFYTQDVLDFYRPDNSKYPVVNGKLSTDTYLSLLDKVYKEYSKKYDTNFTNICFHIPYPKLALKGLRQIQPNLEESFLNTVKLNSQVGNIYTGSIFLSFYSLISNSSDLKVSDRIGMYSYGSGAVAEFFCLKLEKNFKQKPLDLSSRIRVSVEEYEDIFFNDKEVLEKEEIYFEGIEDNKRRYVINE